MLETIKKSADYIHNTINGNPKTGVILGSGLGGFIDDVNIIRKIPYSSIPEFPNTTVEGHSGLLVHAEIDGKEILIMQGRIHFYEGHSIDQIVFSGKSYEIPWY
jgi:purine-nucleoside phosphorylase